MNILNRLAVAALVAFCSFRPSESDAAMPPKIPPGAYGETYTCNDGVAHLVNIYVLDQFEPEPPNPEFWGKPDKTPYQKVRVEAGDAVFVGRIILNGTGQVRIISSSYEIRPTDKDRNITTFDITSFSGGLQGLTKFERDSCSLVPSNNANLKPVSSMSYSTRVGLDPSDTKSDPQLKSVLEKIVTADSLGWLGNVFDRGSVREVTIVQGAMNTGSFIMRGSYTYNQGSRGWVEAKIVNGSLSCLIWWDGGPRCKSLRTAEAAARGRHNIENLTNEVSVAIADAVKNAGKSSGNSAVFREQHCHVEVLSYNPNGQSITRQVCD